MSKSSSNAGKKAQRKEIARKKAKRKRLIIISICASALVVAVVIAVVLAVRSSAQQSSAETYSDGSQTVLLLADGTFTASLAHSVNKNGTYTKTAEGSGFEVIFSIAGVDAVGRIENDALHIPEEWEDDHGHGGVLKKK